MSKLTTVTDTNCISCDGAFFYNQVFSHAALA